MQDDHFPQWHDPGQGPVRGQSAQPARDPYGAQPQVSRRGYYPHPQDTVGAAQTAPHAASVQQPVHQPAQPHVNAQPQSQRQPHLHPQQQAQPYTQPQAQYQAQPQAQNQAQYGAQQSAPHASPHGYRGAADAQAQFVPTDQSDDPAYAAMPKLGPAQWAGAAVSLSLVLMIGFWGVNQMIRDVSGVPVIRALEGEARAVPDDPGGQLASHQGLAVNSVTADGSASAPADRLALAPRPTALLAEDQAMGALAPEAALVAYAPATDAYAIVPEDENAATASTGAQLAPQSDLEQVAVAPAALELNGIETTSAPTDAALASEIAAGAILRSPIPTARPVRVAAAAIPSATQSDAAPLAQLPSLEGVAGDILAAVGSAGEVHNANLAVDTPMVQLGAFPNAEGARAEWDRLMAKYPQFLEDKQRVVVEASSGGKTFYRLRAIGFHDEASSNSFCAAFEAMNAPCVPVRRN